jgi:hypothetical protein
MRSGVLCGPPSVHICRPCPLPVTHSLLQNLKVHPMFDTRCTLCSRLENPCPRPVHLLRFLSFSHAKKRLGLFSRTFFRPRLGTLLSVHVSPSAIPILQTDGYEWGVAQASTRQRHLKNERVGRGDGRGGACSRSRWVIKARSPTCQRPRRRRQSNDVWPVSGTAGDQAGKPGSCTPYLRYDNERKSRNGCNPSRRCACPLGE